MMNDAASETRAFQRQTRRAAAQRAVAELQAKGMQFNEISAGEQERMRAVAAPVAVRRFAEYDPATVKLYKDELARTRKWPPRTAHLRPHDAGRDRRQAGGDCRRTGRAA